MPEMNSNKNNTLICEHLPECPHLKSVSKVQDYFRVMINGQIETKNFIGKAYLPNAVKLKTPENCDTCAVSINPTPADAQGLIQSVPAFRRGTIIKLEIKAHHGLVHDNYPGHANWWHPKEFDPTTIARSHP
jgi:hypothetical protein